jgi:hypothetical protein
LFWASVFQKKDKKILQKIENVDNGTQNILTSTILNLQRAALKRIKNIFAQKVKKICFHQNVATIIIKENLKKVQAINSLNSTKFYRV